MASLLVWFAWDEADVEPLAWPEMCRRAQQRTRFTGFAQSGPGWCVWAAPTTGLDCMPVQWQRDASGESLLVLIDRPCLPGNALIFGANWSVDDLMDGEATAAVVLDFKARRVTALRDRMGQRNVVWARVPGGLILASGEHVLRAHPAVSAQLDRVWLAACLAALPPNPEATVWQDVHTLAAGQKRVWQRSRSTLTTSPLVPNQDWHGLTDKQIQARFEELLFASVDKCIHGSQRVGVSLSAGMDSSTLAWIASHRNACEERPLAVTYGFDTWPEIDERAMVAELAQCLDIEHVSFDASEMHPFRPECARPVDPDTPLQTPYREWKEAAYRHFAAGGVDVVLSGNFSDHLWAAPRFWLFEALRLGRWRTAISILNTIRCRSGTSAVLTDWGVRALARPWRLLDVPVPERLSMLAQPWRDQVREIWEVQGQSVAHWPRPSQAMSVLSSSASFDAYGEDWFAAQHRLAFRQPFRDAALTAWMLSIPADLSYRGHRWKWLMRRAMADRLPTSVVDRPKGSDLRPIARAALADQRVYLERLATERMACLDGLLASPMRGVLEETDTTWIRVGLALWLNQSAGASAAAMRESTRG